MHIPDGYLSPQTEVVFGAAMIPVWFKASRAIRKVVKTQQWLVELIAELGRGGKTIVMATHDLDVLDVVADRGVVFSEAHSIVAEATPHELLSSLELLRSVNLI